MSVGNAGWVAFDDVDLPGPLYLRFFDDGGRLRVREMYLPARTGGIAGQDISTLSLTGAEALANANGDAIRSRLKYSGPQLDVLASYYGSTFGNFERELATGNWVAASIAAQSLPPRQARGKGPGGAPLYRVPLARRAKDWVVRETDLDFRLQSGPQHGLTDDFLTDVRRAYQAALARGERPNVALVEQTGHPPKTVQRWVYTARQRGIMPKGRKGAAG